ncbi:MAG: hypothetical protein IPN92_17620 [Chromatiaceae bacterium]|nr:hypothetical protein [Chromatiaceae bacterium]
MRYLPLLAGVLTLATGLAQAATPANVCANLGATRTALVTLLDEADTTKQHAYVEQIKTTTAAVDADLATMAGGPEAAKVNAFKPTWDAFKATRDGEIVPAVKAGDIAKAKGLATGVQAGRMKEMKAAMGCN